MERLSKNLKKCQDLDNQKPQSMERHFFTCFCGKNYDTYPSLYLHSKKIHDRWINKKHLKITSFRWSGSIKNKYYELQEQKDEGQQKQVPTEKNCTPRNYKNNSIKENILKKEHPESKGQINQAQFDKIKQRIEHVFSLYLLSSVDIRGRQSQQIGKEYMKYILQSQVNFKKINCYQQLINQNCLQLIPLLMNDYTLRQGVGEKEKRYEQITSQLERISQWMYQKGYCKYLAILQMESTRKQFENANNNKKQQINI